MSCPRCAYIGTLCASCERDGTQPCVRSVTTDRRPVTPSLDMSKDVETVNLTVEVLLEDYRRLVRRAGERGEALGDYLRWALTELT